MHMLQEQLVRCLHALWLQPVDAVGLVGPLGPVRADVEVPAPDLGDLLSVVELPLALLEVLVLLLQLRGDDLEARGQLAQLVAKVGVCGRGINHCQQLP